MVIFIVPSVTLATWWNPKSWKIFHKKEQAPQTQTINAPEIKDATTKQTSNTEKIKKSQKQSDVLKKKQANPITKTPKTSAKEIESIPVVNNTEADKLAMQIEKEAEVQAKAEKNALISKQKEELDQLKLELKKANLKKETTQTITNQENTTPPTPPLTYQEKNGPRFILWTDSAGNTINSKLKYYKNGAWEQISRAPTPLSMSGHPTLTVTVTAEDPNGRSIQYRQNNGEYSSNNSFTFNVEGTPGTSFRPIIQIKNDDEYVSYVINEEDVGRYNVDEEWGVNYTLAP